MSRLRTYKPLRAKKALRPRRKTAAEKREREMAREFVWTRDNGHCQYRTSPKCLGFVPLNGSVFERGHFAHTVSRWKLPKKDKWNPKYGKLACYFCHIVEEHTKGNKPQEASDVAAE